MAYYSLQTIQLSMRSPSRREGGLTRIILLRMKVYKLCSEDIYSLCVLLGNMDVVEMLFRSQIPDFPDTMVSKMTVQGMPGLVQEQLAMMELTWCLCSCDRNT